VPVSPSSSRAIETLVNDLASDDDVVREAAIARLAVIGSRAVGRLTAIVDAPQTAGRVKAAALQALEAAHDERALGPALHAASDADPAVAAAAIGVLRAFMRERRGAAAVDRLTALALDRTVPTRSRLHAIRALADLDTATRDPIWKLLEADGDAEIRDEVGPRRRRAPDDLAAVAERGIPDEPDLVRRLIASAGAAAPLPVLHRVLERIGEREAIEAAARRAEWTRVRAAVHLALANRGSRLALYDLRESIETAGAPLPVDFLSAIGVVGDKSCLEPIAAAYQRADDDWWGQQLASAFDSIAARERVTKRHAVMKKIAGRWPRILAR